MVIDCRNYQSNKHGMSWRFHSPLDVGFVPAFAMRASNKKFNRPSSPGLNPRNWRVRRCLGGPTLDPKKGTKEWACHCWGAKSFLGQAVARYRNCNFQSHHVIQNWVLSPPELSVSGMMLMSWTTWGSAPKGCSWTCFNLPWPAGVWLCRMSGELCWSQAPRWQCRKGESDGMLSRF